MSHRNSHRPMHHEPGDAHGERITTHNPNPSTDPAWHRPGARP